MDPGLWELLEQGYGDDEVAAIVRTRPDWHAPPGVRVVTRFGDIATVRIRRNAIPELHDSETVLSVKPPQMVVPDFDPFVGTGFSEQPMIGFPDDGEALRPTGVDATGKGVVVGILDWGMDFAHPEFLRPDGGTRLLAIWDQRDASTTSAEFPPHGRVYSADEIDAALRTATPYASLGYHHADAARPGQSAHGTHVTGIAAGSHGIAPEAEIVFVHLAARGTHGLANLGDSSAILEAVDFVSRTAGNRPVSINISAGRQAGAHDGRSPVEMGLDAFLSESPGRAICQSTGNYYAQHGHASGRIGPNEQRTLRFVIDPADITPNEVEVWYAGEDIFSLELRSPDGSIIHRVPLGENLATSAEGREIVHTYHRENDPNNNKRLINIFLYPGAPAGEWELTLSGEDIVDGRFHSWIERDATCLGCQSRFIPDHSSPLHTTGTIANGFRTIAAGAYDARSPTRDVAYFSSSGPTLDGRVKPDLLAPGVSVLSACSAPPNAVSGEPLYCRMSGTSMAAPHVTGCAALMMQAASRPLSIGELRRLLLQLNSTDRAPDIETARSGSGYLNIARAVAAARPDVTEMVATSSEDLVLNRLGEDDPIKELHRRTDVEESIQRVETDDRPDLEQSFETSPLTDTVAEASRDEETIVERAAPADSVVDEPMTLDDLFVGPPAVLGEQLDGLFSDSENNESSGRRIVSLAEAIVLAGQPLSLSRLLSDVSNDIDDQFVDLGEDTPNDRLFDSFVYGGELAHLEPYLTVVAQPGETPLESLRAGDIMVSRGPGRFAHMAVLAGAPDSGDTQEWAIRPGDYAIVVEGGAKPHTVAQAFRRRVLDAKGRVPTDSLILRIRPEMGPVHEPTEESFEERIARETRSDSVRLKWTNLKKIRGSDGHDHLFYLTSGNRYDPPVQFHLEVTNTTSGTTFEDAWLLVRLESRDSAGNVKVVPLRGQEPPAPNQTVPGYKRIRPFSASEPKTLSPRASRSIELCLDHGTLADAYNSDYPRCRFVVEFHWRQGYGTDRRYHFASNPVSFYLVTPLEFLWSTRKGDRVEALVDRERYFRYWTSVLPVRFFSGDRLPVRVQMTLRTTVSDSSTGEVTVTGSAAETRGEQRSETQQVGTKASLGIDEIVKLGMETQATSTFSVTNMQSFTYQLTQAARRSRTVMRAFEKTVTVDRNIEPARPEVIRTIYLIPRILRVTVDIVRFDGPNPHGQATGRTVHRGQPMALLHDWLSDIQEEKP